MHIISIGLTIKNYLNGRELTRFSFLSTQTLLDADLIFWDVETFQMELQTPNDYLGSGDEWMDIFEKRRKEFVEYFQLGRSMIITSPNFKNYTVSFTEYGKTDEFLNFSALLPIQNVVIEEKSGKSIQAAEIEIVKDCMGKMAPFLYYNHYFPNPEGIPLMFIKGTKYVVSQYLKVGKGLILFMPSFNFQGKDFADIKIFNETIIELVHQLNIIKIEKKNDKKELPEWSKKIELAGEKDEKAMLYNFQLQKNEIEASINFHLQKIEEYENLKNLFVGTGDDLEGVVRLVFSEMGFEIEEPEKGRDDLIIHHGDFVAVIEAKGIDGSSGEKHAAQLQKWVSAYHEKHEKEPKGILIANTYRKIPLHERTQEDFPNQMLKYVERMGHCLMTGLQLLYLLLDFRRKEIDINGIVSLLSNTVGILKYGSEGQYFDNLPNQE